MRPGIWYPGSRLWASVMLTMVAVILGGETFGEYAAPELGIAPFADAFWGLFPLLVLYRMITRPHPFTTAAPLQADTAAGRSSS